MNVHARIVNVVCVSANMFSNVADCKLLCKEHLKPLNNPTSGISLLVEALLYLADPEQMCMWNVVGLLDNKAHLC